MSDNKQMCEKIYFDIVIYENVKDPNKIKLINELDSLCKFIMSLSKKNRKHDFISVEKIVFLDSYEKTPDNIINIKFTSAKYNQAKPVIDTITLQDKGVLKKPKDGDKEYTHISIRPFNSKSAIAIIESNYHGITAKKITDYLNEYTSIKANKKGEKVKFRYEHNIYANSDFIDEVKNHDEIKLVTVTFEKELLAGDFEMFSNRNDVKDTMDLVIKPTSSLGINLSTIKELIEFKKVRKVQKLSVRCKAGDGLITLNTEKMKTKFELTVERSSNSEVVTSSFYKSAMKELRDE